MAKGFILRLTFTYLIIYFVIHFNDFSYFSLVRYRQFCCVSEKSRSPKKNRKSIQSCYSKCGPEPAALALPETSQKCGISGSIPDLIIRPCILTRSTVWFLHTLKLEKLWLIALIIWKSFQNYLKFLAVISRMWEREFIMHVHVFPAVQHEALLICDWNKKTSYKICLYWYELSDSEIFHIIHTPTERKKFMCLSNFK